MIPALLVSPSGSARSLVAPALGTLLLLAGPAVAGAASPVPPAPATVSRGVCSTAPLDPQGRAASFSVRMVDAPPTSSYGFAVRLQERMPGSTWKTLKGAAVPTGFGDFKTARSGAPRMTRLITVQGLHPGSSYRLRVTFRWNAASGGTRSIRRTSRACAVKDVRPDVGLTGEFGWQPSTTGGEVAYRIGLRTDGLAALAGIDVPVVVRQGQTVLAMGTVRPSAAKEALLLAGRRCVQDVPVTVQLDPDGLLDDRDATDDVLTAACLPVGR